MMLRWQLLMEKPGWREPYLPDLLHFVTSLQYEIQTGWSRSEPVFVSGDLKIVCNTMTLSGRHQLDKKRGLAIESPDVQKSGMVGWPVDFACRTHIAPLA